MDEVWILSLCLTVFALFLFIFTLKSSKEPEPESISKKSAPSTASYSSSSGKSLELQEDDMEKMMERLNKLLYQDEPKKKEVHQERKKPVVQEKAQESPLHIKDLETQEPVGKEPEHTQPAYQPSQRRVQERSAAPPVENIMDEIEQAVQETVEQDYYARRRQERAGRAAARTKPFAETDSQ